MIGRLSLWIRIRGNIWTLMPRTKVPNSCFMCFQPQIQIQGYGVLAVVAPIHFCSSFPFHFPFPYLIPDAQPLFYFRLWGSFKVFVIGSVWVMRGILGGRDGVLFLLERWEVYWLCCGMRMLSEVDRRRSDICSIDRVIIRLVLSEKVVERG